MHITATSFPVPPEGDLRVHTVERATITPFGRGRRRVAWGQPSWYTTGAVYDADGALDRLSQRVGSLSHDHALAADPSALPPDSGTPRRLTGTWLFGGTWFNHFGHFLTESVTTLWPDAAVDGLVFVPFWFGREVLPWQQEMLLLAGCDVIVDIVGAGRVEVEHLVVSERPVIPNGHIRPEAVAVWRRIARSAGEPVGRRVFLSRSMHNRTVPEGSRAARRVAVNEGELDQMMHDLGFVVVHPERLSLRDQVATVAGAEVIAGVGGSSLHLSAFAPPESLVIELGDPRGATEPVLTQQLLTHACDHRLAHIPFTGTDRNYDLGAIATALAHV